MTITKKIVKKKRKVGRPKKRGPKKKRRYVSKKPKIDGRTLVDRRKYYNYKIIYCCNHKQIRNISKFENIKDAFDELKRLEKENEKVVFRRMIKASGEIKETFDEYVLLEKNTTGDKKDSMIRDKYGKFTQVSSTSNGWVILDSAPMYIEETFYVYGYDNKRDRKTFSWIYDNIITGGINDTREMKRVLVYKNKVVIKNDDGSFDIIFCKYTGDAIRFYNLLSETVKKNKQKQIYFLGSYSEISDKRRKLEQELMEYTGMSKLRLQMNATDYY